ncbi:MAG TPA: hypothetical protein VFT30_03025 [Nitrospira sp.]|nr:hypothetical protein [Nitrospira sp.]
MDLEGVEEFAALRADQRDTRLAEFLNRQQRDGHSPQMVYFAMTIEFTNLDEVKEHDCMACMRGGDLLLAVARHVRDGEWEPANTPLDAARELMVSVGTSMATEHHARDTWRRLYGQFKDLLPEVKFTPEVGDRVTCLAVNYFGSAAIVTEIFPAPPANPDRRLIYGLSILDQDGVAYAVAHTSNVLPPIAPVE